MLMGLYQFVTQVHYQFYLFSLHTLNNLVLAKGMNFIARNYDNITKDVTMGVEEAVWRLPQYQWKRLMRGHTG